MFSRILGSSQYSSDIGRGVIIPLRKSLSSNPTEAAAPMIGVRDGAINTGTILVCTLPPDDRDQLADIYKSTTSHTIIGTVSEGDQVIAAGRPEDAGWALFM